MFATLVDFESGGAFEQEGSGAGGEFQYVRGNYNSLKEGDKSDGCSNKTSLYITCLVIFSILEGLMLDVVCNPVFGCSKQRVKSS